MNNYTVFISSSDAYADLWPLFFDMFKKYWPEYKGAIYLNTEFKEFYDQDLDIQCTQVGLLDSFGRTFRAGLQKVETPDVLLVMIDYIFMGKVNNELLEEYFNYFKSNNLDSLCLRKNPYTKVLPLYFKGLNLVIPPSKDMFSYQIAFWKKEMLFEMALPHENPWLSEWYGTLRANQMKLRLAYTSDIVIPYLAEGALHKGKWVEPMIKFLNNLDYPVDFLKRGIFLELPVTINSRITQRIHTFIPRCLSVLDLLKRKYIN